MKTADLNKKIAAFIDSLTEEEAKEILRQRMRAEDGMIRVDDVTAIGKQASAVLNNAKL